MDDGHRPPRHGESESGGPALIVIDMLNQYEHEDADRLAASVETTVPAIRALLDRSGVNRLVLAGQVTEQCILYRALDAYVRHFEVAVPPDAVAPIHESLGKAALEMMERNMSAELTEAAQLRFSSASSS